MATLLVIDNYDSFTYNLVQMFLPYDLQIQVYRSDKITLRDVDAMDPDYVLISPGPKDPAHAGISVDLITEFGHRTPILGVCLGMQCINEAFGGVTGRAPLPVHGKISRVIHNQTKLFSSVPTPFAAARYHSLMVILPSNHKKKGLEVTARSHDGVIMGLSHRQWPIHGVQFHPESFMTEWGFCMVENFLRLGSLSKQPSFLNDACKGIRSLAHVKTPCGIPPVAGDQPIHAFFSASA